MSWRAIATTFICLACLFAPHAAADDATDAVLILVERQDRYDLAHLRQRDVPVVFESVQSLLVEGEERWLGVLRSLGFRARVIEPNAWAFDFLQVGVRPDTDMKAIGALGEEIHREGPWRLVKIPRGTRPDRFEELRAFITLLPHQPIEAGPLGGGPDRSSDRLDDEEPDPIIQKMVDAVTPAQVQEYWTDLTENPPTGTRMSTSAGCRDAADYVHAAFLGYGIHSEKQSYGSGNHAPNVVGEHAGAITPEHVYIVIGHLDDLPWWGPAPGANDNASGSVTVMTAADVMSCFAHRSTVKFIACTGEEWGLLGSDAYAEEAQARGEDIRGVLNFDMNGWEGDGLPDPENLDLNYNTASEELALLYAESASKYDTGLVVDAFYCPDLTASDHYSFWKRGYKAICGITDNEGYCDHGGNYPHYHTSQDTIPNCGDPSFFYSTIRTTVATLTTLADPFKITFVEDSRYPGETFDVVLGDRDLNTNASNAEEVGVEVWSDTEPEPESVTLTEESANSMIFRGEVDTATGDPVSGDGLVSVSEGDTIYARYVDELDCDGSTEVPYTSEARIDSWVIPPEIEGVRLEQLPSSTRVSWQESESATEYDVAGGDVEALRTSGNFDDAGCLANDVPGSPWDDERSGPAPDAAFYYLVRGASPAGSGTYGDMSDGSERVLTPCP